MDEPEVQEESGTTGGRLRGLMALEAIALGIALAVPITPSRTGSTWSPADLFTADPGYPQKVLASFVTVNLMFVVLGVVVWVVGRFGRPG